MSDTLHRFLQVNGSIKTINNRTYYVLNTFNTWHAFTLKGEQITRAHSYAHLKQNLESYNHAH